MFKTTGFLNKIKPLIIYLFFFLMGGQYWQIHVKFVFKHFLLSRSYSASLWQKSERHRDGLRENLVVQREKNGDRDGDSTHLGGKPLSIIML